MVIKFKLLIIKRTNIKLNNNLIKNPIINIKIKVIEARTSNIKSNKMKSISNHQTIKSKLLIHIKSKTRLKIPSYISHLSCLSVNLVHQI